jgi:hypothetical protein
VKVLNHLCAVSLEALNREIELYVNHIHEDKEKEEETIIVHNPSWHSAFAGDCSIRWPYLSVGSGLLSPATRLRQIRPDNVVLRCRAVLTRRYEAIFHRGGFANPYRTEVSLYHRGAVRPYLLFAVTCRKRAHVRVSDPRPTAQEGNRKTSASQAVLLSICSHFSSISSQV